jgi:hypothetical protein
MLPDPAPRVRCAVCDVRRAAGTFGRTGAGAGSSQRRGSRRGGSGERPSNVGQAGTVALGLLPVAGAAPLQPAAAPQASRLAGLGSASPGRNHGAPMIMGRDHGAPMVMGRDHGALMIMGRDHGAPMPTRPRAHTVYTHAGGANCGIVRSALSPPPSQVSRPPPAGLYGFAAPMQLHNPSTGDDAYPFLGGGQWVAGALSK